MRAVLERALRALSSLRLACVLLILLGILTWLGTLEQVSHGLFEVQKKYFESFVLVHRIGLVPIPLPGANLVLSLLFLNLLVGGVLRLRKGAATAGILVAHLGILLLLVSAFVKHRYSDEGHVTLYEGQRAETFQSYFLWEIAILEDLGEGRAREHVIPNGSLEDAGGTGSARFGSDALPFELVVSRFLKNSSPRIVRSGSTSPAFAVDGVALEELPLHPQSEANIAGAVVEIVDEKAGMRRTGLLWGAEAKPLVVTCSGKEWAITLRRQTRPLPFVIALDRFTKEDHPRIEMPKSFSSDVTVTEDGTSRPVRISMNAPLRQKGFVLYQASWGPAGAAPGTPLFSTLAVVRNPADRLPLAACIVIAAGLVAHFSRRLFRFIRVEGQAGRSTA